ncbi:hypothetical protein O0L34_g16523 [Tuta absoluta]|nr:hypothetical protein O0L34_g16523 [Tuta absoluta]
MALQELQGKTLGEKKKHYSELVKQAVDGDKKIQAEDFNPDENDVTNLMKIDIAAKTRNVDYILKILKCEDMLYVSRAIKQSKWLIADRQYSHIINPRHLNENLYPNMTSQAYSKLLLHIRLHLKDTDRVEDFYNYIKEKDVNTALCWLPNCSLPFVETEVEKNRENINNHLLKRLCEKSITILEIIAKNCPYYYSRKSHFEETIFLLNSYTNKYLDLVESAPTYTIPYFGSKHTSILMKKCPQRIIDKFETYCSRIHLQTFAKHFKPDEIKEFIMKIAAKKEIQSWIKYDNLKHFLRYIPIEGRFDFIKKFLIEKSSDKEEEEMECEMSYAQCSMKCSDNVAVRSSANIYKWYRFAPFKVAFADLTKLIRSESAPPERIAMFGVLLSCANRNLQDIQTVLQYYNDRHINEPFKFKIQFVNMLLKNIDTYRFNETAWNTLNNVFCSMEVYVESENNVQTCVEAIILYKLLHDKKIPEIIQKKFNFQSMKSIQKKLKDQEKPKVFDFLFKTVKSKIENKNIGSENDLNETVILLEEVQLLLTDWNKNQHDCPWFLEKVKELIKLRNDNSWKTNLSAFFTKNKSWRKIMFEESLKLYPSEQTCYHALKHDPLLLSRNQNTVDELRGDDKVCLRRVLRALRVYWPQSLAAEWVTWYLSSLEKPSAHKSHIRGLSMLATHKQIVDVVIKYAPSEFKINWSEDDENVLNIRKHLARNMYVSRPPISPAIILLYAKGDYLQFALPSLNSILHNLSPAQTRELISKLLDAPVSLQKHGIRVAFSKLESSELKIVFHDIWKKAKNVSIRAVLFEQTYQLLCKQKNPSMIEEIWGLLSIFIDNLSTEENKIIYDTLTKVDKVPMLVRGKFFMKSFTFLKSLPTKANCGNAIDSLVYQMEDLLDQLDSDFVANVLLESLDKKFTTTRYPYRDLMAAYLLHASDVDSQLARYKKVVLPVLERSFALWDVKVNDDYWARNNVIDLLKMISENVKKYVFEKKMVFPTKIFTDIQEQLEKRLPVEANYLTQTTWKLIATYMKLLEEHKDMLSSTTEYKQIYLKALPKFSEICLDFMREDMKKYFTSIYWLFAECLCHAFKDVDELVYLECLHLILKDESFVPSYLVAIKNIPHNYYCEDESKKKISILREKIFSNPSMEVKWHYYKKFTRHETEK